MKTRVMDTLNTNIFTSAQYLLGIATLISWRSNCRSLRQAHFKAWVENHVASLKNHFVIPGNRFATLKSGRGTCKSHLGAVKNHAGAIKNHSGAMNYDLATALSDFGMIQNHFLVNIQYTFNKSLIR